MKFYYYGKTITQISYKSRKESKILPMINKIEKIFLYLLNYF